MTAALPAGVLLLRSDLTCPFCRACHVQSMPVDACIYLFECTACGAMLRPKPGDCCVFCSFGSVPCPPVQLARAATGVRPDCCG